MAKTLKKIDKSKSNELTETKTFQPTPAMRVWLDSAVELATDNKTLISEHCKVTRASWYEWLKLEEFEDWFFAEYQRKRRRWLPQLDEIGMKYAKKGSYQHWEMLNKKVGDVPNSGPTTAVQINFSETKSKDKSEYEL